MGSVKWKTAAEQAEEQVRAAEEQAQREFEREALTLLLNDPSVADIVSDAKSRRDARVAEIRSGKFAPRRLTQDAPDTEDQ